MIKQSQILLAVMLGSSISALSVNADDMDIKEHKASGFTGYYIGAALKADHITIGGTAESDTSMGYGALLGWRFQLNDKLLLGLEGNLDSRTGELKGYQSSFAFDYSWQLTTTIATVVGEGNNHMLYARLGVGGIKVDPTIHGRRFRSEHFEGALSALGYEWRLRENVGVRTEVSYISYDEELDFEQTQSSVSIIYNF